ncbi:Uu.00g000860.m01.CDS01 [Anthostomella pinea]|uniref:Uu.00g000860.m01.CDS01 n=1 Tax=Anthostomella pinea TaxID=933095 RepID=A0AAI8YIH2_9PEZI|nr:Uu.00g000860.m01.CDS01 [Anthostomella pinea]
MEITSAGIGDIRRAPKRMTSSIWSPHLRMDRRATRYSIWEAPSVSWSAESGMFGKRNIQVVLFILGFGIPFAWMIAAFLPLPPKPMVEMQQRDRSTTTFRTPEEADPESLNTRVGPMDDSRFQSARWWRNLNRFMSIVGLLLLGAVAALVVIGLRQNW